MDIAVEGSIDGFDYTHLEVSASYQLGCVNYFSGANDPRGLYVTVKPVKLSNSNGFTGRSCILFGKGSFKFLVKDLGRKNQKQLDLLEETINGLDQQQVLALWQTGQFRELMSFVMGAMPDKLKVAA